MADPPPDELLNTRVASRVWLKHFLAPLPFLIGIVVALGVAFTNNFAALPTLIGLGLGAGFTAFLSVIYRRMGATKLPDPDHVAFSQYWQSYADAHQDLGMPSLSANVAAAAAKRSLKPRSKEADYWAAYDSAHVRVRSFDFAREAYKDYVREETLAAQKIHPRSAVLYPETGMGDRDDGWRSAVPMPARKPGQSAHDYWAEFDEARLAADQMTHDERVTIANAGAETLAFQELASRNWRPRDEGVTREPSPERLKVPDPKPSPLPIHLALIAETKLARDVLDTAASNHKGALGNMLARMGLAVDRVVSALRDEPQKLFEVQRLFTYYLPEVAKLLQARDQMAELGEIERVSEIDAVLTRIELAFTQFAKRMHATEIAELDIDLRLLDQSLAAEFG